MKKFINVESGIYYSPQNEGITLVKHKDTRYIGNLKECKNFNEVYIYDIETKVDGKKVNHKNVAINGEGIFEKIGEL